MKGHYCMNYENGIIYGNVIEGKPLKIENIEYHYIDTFPNTFTDEQLATIKQAEKDGSILMT